MKRDSTKLFQKYKNRRKEKEMKKTKEVKKELKDLTPEEVRDLNMVMMNLKKEEIEIKTRILSSPLNISITTSSRNNMETYK